MDTLLAGAGEASPQPQEQTVEEGAVSGETQPREEGVYVPNDPMIYDIPQEEGTVSEEETQSQEDEEGGEEETQPSIPPELLEKLPEKFRNAADPLDAIVKSYSEAEKELSRAKNQLHEYEQALAQFIMGQAGQKAQSQPQQELADISDDDIITGKELKEYINRVLQQQIMPVLSQAQFEQAKAQLKAMHPDYEQVIGSPDFVDFVQKNIPPSVLQIADRDPATASWVIQQYKQHKGQALQAQQRAQQEQVRREKLNQVAQPSQKKPAGEKVFRASELRELMIKDPAKYEALQPEIVRAIREGRFIND